MLQKENLPICADAVLKLTTQQQHHCRQQHQ